jgi:nucleotide-binding universal stress UspA family protein
VVGVNGATSTTALAQAFEQAAARGCRLVAVSAYSVRRPAVVGEAGQDDDQRRYDALSDALGPCRVNHPDVPVEPVVLRGRPADVLTALSRHAQLVVVGSRGRGGFPGLLLGSTSQGLIHNAGCPVLIARG